MNVLLPLLPLLFPAILPETPLEVRYPEATKTFHCTFDESWDKNFDEFPDGWIPQRGPGYPHYVSIAISDEPAVVGDRCLRIDLDGGAATAFSPPITVGPYDFRDFDGSDAAIQAEREETGKEIRRTIEDVILPMLRSVEEGASPRDQAPLGHIREGLEEITSAFAGKLSKEFAALTPTELRICHLVRQGLGIKQVAQLEHV